MADKKSISQSPGAMEGPMKETLSTFQTQLNAMLTQVTTAMETYKQAALQSGNQMKTEYTKGVADLQGQVKKASADMVESYTKSYNELKASLKENYDSLYAQAKTNIDKVTGQFKTSIPPLILSLPGPQKKFVEDITKTMDDNSARTLEALTTNYHELMTLLDTGYKEGLKAIELATANITKNVGFRAAADAPTSTSKPTKK